MTFKEFVEKKQKGWIAKKKDVISLWKSLHPDIPFNPAPVPNFHSGNRFDQDGVRITGSSQFINSVLARLKPFLFYVDHPNLDLDIKYRQVLRRDVTDKSSFACYINVLQKKD